jgi:site-specific DNA recombinase
VLSVAINPRRAGKENRLLIEGPGDPNVAPNRSLVRLLGQAQRFQDLALRGDGRSVSMLAAEVGVVPSYFTRILRLSFLGPDMVRLILDGRHPSRLTAKALTEQSPKLPNDWIEQAAMLGFA